MIYSYRIRRELQRARQELSHSLYRNDAALRTIARLNQQLTTARAALAGMERPDPSLAMEIGGEDEVGLDKDVIEAIDEKSEELTGNRRKRGKEAPEGDAKVDEIKTMTMKSENKNLHDSSPAGITCMDMKVSVLFMVQILQCVFRATLLQLVELTRKLFYTILNRIPLNLHLSDIGKKFHRFCFCLMLKL